MAVNWTPAFCWAFAYLVIGNSVIAVGLLLAMIRAGPSVAGLNPAVSGPSFGCIYRVGHIGGAHATLWLGLG